MRSVNAKDERREKKREKKRRGHHLHLRKILKGVNVKMIIKENSQVLSVSRC